MPALWASTNWEMIQELGYPFPLDPLSSVFPYSLGERWMRNMISGAATYTAYGLLSWPTSSHSASMEAYSGSR